MKGLIATALVLLLAGTAYAQEVTDEFDRFTGKRNIGFQDKPSLQAASISSYAVISESDAKYFSIISMFSSSRGSGSAWRYLSCNTTHWLIDGKPFSLDKVSHEGKVMRGGVVEYLVQPMSEAQMRAIAAASTVEYKICNDEYKMTQVQHDGLRGVVAALDRQS